LMCDDYKIRKVMDEECVDTSLSPLY